jgi:EAL domain-containing protein (putative c-di-GMP-specific phosphodiesterase class I)
MIPGDTERMDISSDQLDPLSYAIATRDRGTIKMVEDALEHRNVALAYQPVIPAGGTGTVAYYEGLIRVYDETGRIIPARDFIHQIEATETGRKIDAVALDLGLRQLAEHPDLRLAINMSARSIGYPRWMKTLRKGLMRDPTAGERLILEITECSAMLIPELVTGFMADMRRHGIGFALDDFGAGYTSFRYLRNFLFDVLKIDGQFIKDVANNPDNQVLTKSLIAISQQMDMLTIAEQVENGADADWLTQAGIDCLQGYYFAAPTIHPPWIEQEQEQATGT